MLTEILAELKKQSPELECWTHGVTEESFKDNTLTINIPDKSYLQRYEKECKDKIAEIASKKLGRKIYVQLQLLPSESKIIQPQEVVKPIIKTDLKKFDGNPNFKDKAEVEKYFECIQKPKGGSVTMSVVESKLMPNPYNVKKVICCTGFSHEYFTIPNDRRKTANVKLKIRCQNGDIKEYDLYRGQSVFSGKKGEGQLNTTHAKILLAIIHIWQKQGCRFIDNQFSSMVVLSLRQLASVLGYKKFGGTTRQWLLRHLKELKDRHNMLSDGKNSLALTFITDIIQQNSKNNGDRSKLAITLNPFISKQLYDRKAFYRNPDCYKLKNPTAIKLLLTYDRMITKGNVIQKMVEDIAEDMQIQNNKRKDIIIRNLRNATKELNGYELNDRYNLKVDMVKIGKDWTLIAKGVTKTQTYHNPLPLLPLYHS